MYIQLVTTLLVNACRKEECHLMSSAFSQFLKMCERGLKNMHHAMQNHRDESEPQQDWGDLYDKLCSALKQ
jgi:hypothetical protein